MAFELIDLRRPQYPSSPEVLLSALAWSLVRRARPTQSQGLIYVRHGTRKKGVVINETFPAGEALERYRLGLIGAGLHDIDGELSAEGARACALALKGITPEKGAGTASSAVGVGAALMQDPVGGLAVANPPNFAHLLNTMYKLGGGTGVTAAERWYEAAARHSSDPKLAAIEAPLVKSVLASFLANGDWPVAEPRPDQSSIPGAIPLWWQQEILAASIGTPFSWFRDSWDRLCSAIWYETLPARRWTGWAVCTLRTALGFSFLWEANFYSELARGVLDQDRDAAHAVQRAISPPNPLVPYQRGSVSQMDVMPAISRLLSVGVACRKAIEDAAREAPDSLGSLQQFIEWLRGSNTKALATALAGGGDTGGLSNLLETVRYSLLERGSDSARDHHGLLKYVSKRFTHVSPGAEWIVVMSAVASPGPRETLRLGDVQRSLESLGFKPRIDFLLAELEKAGLCATASDGDEGIEINLGFGAN